MKGPEPLRELAVVGRRLCEPPTGVGRYLECLLRWWGSNPGPFERIRVFAPGEPSIPAELWRGPVELEIARGGATPMIWESVVLPRRLSGRELLFGAYTLPWFQAGRGVVANLGIYDVRPDDFSRWARLRTTPFFRHAARRARRTIANSQSTARDVVRYLGGSPERVDVVLLGADERLGPGERSPQPLPAEVRERYGLAGRPYFLFAGKLSRRRNVPLLIEAFSTARAGGLAEDLVVVGPDYLGLDPPKLAREASVADAFRWIPHAPMEDLAHLYRGATAFVLPTLHEGFSLTIPEAMACGAPAIVFDHAALEGPAREAAWIVRPPERDALAEALRAVSRDAALRARLSAASLAAAQAYRWETTAAETMRILARAAGFAEH